MADRQAKLPQIQLGPAADRGQVDLLLAERFGVLREVDRRQSGFNGRHTRPRAVRPLVSRAIAALHPIKFLCPA